MAFTWVMDHYLYLAMIGPIGDDIYVLVYTMRGETLRAISLRKANRREVLKYVDQA